jgi:hypothetical protein
VPGRHRHHSQCLQQHGSGSSSSSSLLVPASTPWQFSEEHCFESTTLVVALCGCLIVPADARWQQHVASTRTYCVLSNGCCCAAACKGPHSPVSLPSLMPLAQVVACAHTPLLQMRLLQSRMQRYCVSTPYKLQAACQDSQLCVWCCRHAARKGITKA